MRLPPPRTIGWREWAVLPELGLRLRAKLDTGAKTSSIDAQLQHDLPDIGETLTFHVRTSKDRRRRCRAPLQGYRVVKDTGGGRERRPVIRTSIEMDNMLWPIDITLTDRTGMISAMLLGRDAVKGRFYVDPAHTYRLPKPTPPKTRKRRKVKRR